MFFAFRFLSLSFFAAVISAPAMPPCSADVFFSPDISISALLAAYASRLPDACFILRR
jgi:hypothetical protein